MVDYIAQSFISLCLLLLAGHALRRYFAILEKLQLPSSVVAGGLGLVILQLVSISSSAKDWVDEQFCQGWDALPGFLINIVFAVMFLGVNIPPAKEVWEVSGPQLMYGFFLGLGQWVCGMVVGTLLAYSFTQPDAFGAILPIGFEGGHGTAAGMGDAFDDAGFPNGEDFALASATVGIIVGIGIGIALINWQSAKGNLIGQQISALADPLLDVPEEDTDDDYQAMAVQEPELSTESVSGNSIDMLALHVALVGGACTVGWLIKEILLGIQAIWPWAESVGFFSSFPLFPMCMLGGLLIQKTLVRFNKEHIVQPKLMNSLSGLALDFLVMAAVARVKVAAVSSGIVPFLLLMVAGIAWHLFCLLYVAKRMLPDFWFERACAELGRSMGVTATGLLLLRIVDPNGKTPAPAAFSYKLMFQEPLMGGGIWTSLAVLLIKIASPWVVAIIALVGMGLCWSVYFFSLRHSYPAKRAQRLSSVASHLLDKGYKDH